MALRRCRARSLRRRLFPPLRLRRLRREFPRLVETPAATTAEPIPLAELEKRHILAVMEKTPSRTQAAKLLGISIRTLRNKLNEYGVKSKEEEIPAESEEQEG